MVVIIIVAIAFIKLGLVAEKNAKPVYEYSIGRKSDYEVLLKENDFYEDKKLPADLYYASKSIEAFIVDFEYNFEGNNKINTEYNYNVTANLVGTVKDEYQDKEVWNRSFKILQNKSDNQIDTDSFSIKEKINIDYEEYNDLVNSYEREYGIKLNAILKLRFNITYQTDFSNYGIDTEKTDDFIELDIPITNTVTEANKNYEAESLVNILPSMERIKVREHIYYIIAVILIIIAFAISIIKINKNKLTPQEKYEKKVNHILKYYRDIIVTVNNKPNMDDLKIMEVIALDDLIDVAEQNNCNIIHYEDFDNKANYLYAIVGAYGYYYKII